MKKQKTILPVGNGGQLDVVRNILNKNGYNCWEPVHRDAHLVQVGAVPDLVILEHTAGSEDIFFKRISSLRLAVGAKPILVLMDGRPNSEEQKIVNEWKIKWLPSYPLAPEEFFILVRKLTATRVELFKMFVTATLRRFFLWKKKTNPAVV